MPIDPFAVLTALLRAEAARAAAPERERTQARETKEAPAKEQRNTAG